MIKHIITTLTIGLLFSILVSSCKKEPINDAIEQHWKLERFTTLADNQTVVCERIYYSITRFVTTVEEKQGPHNYGTFVARTEYRDNETVLLLKDFKRRWDTGDSKKDATVEQLLPFGINNPLETAFKIVKLSHNQLILESDYARLELKKF